MTGTLIVGGGPAGLALTTALSCQDLGGPVRVVDPSGTWLAAWHRRFAAQDIPMLRSPAVHHPHPDPFALLAHAGGEGLVSSGGTQLPTRACFEAFIDDLLTRRGLRDVVEPVGATALNLDAQGRATVTLNDGEVVRPDRVVLATNARRPQVPAALSAIGQHPRVADAERASVADTPDAGRVVVLGGGLSAAHLAIGAARRGAQVTLVARRRLRVRRFDTHPSWLGPRKRRPFEQEPDAHVRRRTIDTARGGGSIPARFRRELEACAEQGRLQLRERVEVVDATAHGDTLCLHLDDRSRIDADVVWCATGGRIDVAHDPLCRELVARFPATVADGLPDLDADLSWPGTNVHLVGFAGALELGPVAGNLIGHRRAALRITAALRGDDPRRADRVVTGRSACPAEHAAPR